MQTAIITVSGGYVAPNTSDIAKLLANAFNQYTSASAYVLAIANPYVRFPELYDMEKEGSGENYAAAIMKISFMIQQYKTAAEEHPFANVMCTANYLDDVLLQFIHNEIQIAAKNKEDPNEKEISNNVLQLLYFANEKGGLRLPNITIPYSESDEPEKVIYNPVELSIYENAMKNMTLFELGYYIFAGSAIQATAYYAFGYYNRFLETLKPSSQEMYTLSGEKLPTNYFATTSPSTMSFFESFVKEEFRIKYLEKSFSSTEKADEEAPAVEKTEEATSDVESSSEEETIDIGNIDMMSPDSEEEVPDIPEGDDIDE